MTGSLFRHGRGEKSNSKDIMLQRHDARTPATVGPIAAGLTTSETTATASVPPKASTRERSWMPVTVGSTAEEIPARAWVPTTAWTRA